MRASAYLSFNLSSRGRFLFASFGGLRKRTAIITWKLRKFSAIFAALRALKLQEEKVQRAVLNPITLFCVATIILESGILPASWPTKNLWRVKESYEDNPESLVIKAQAQWEDRWFPAICYRFARACIFTRFPRGSAQPLCDIEDCIIHTHTHTEMIISDTCYAHALKKKKNKYAFEQI